VCTSSVPKEDDVFPRLPYCDWGGPRIVASAPRFVASALRFVAGAPRLVAGTARVITSTFMHSQTCRQCPWACHWRSEALPDAAKVISGSPKCSQTYRNHPHSTAVPVIWDPRYFEGRPECPPRAWYSPVIDTSKFTLHILLDTPGGFHWLEYIL